MRATHLFDLITKTFSNTLQVTKLIIQLPQPKRSPLPPVHCDTARQYWSGHFKFSISILAQLSLIKLPHSLIRYSGHIWLWWNYKPTSHYEITETHKSVYFEKRMQKVRQDSLTNLYRYCGRK